jgi:hypothetical protein
MGGAMGFQKNLVQRVPGGPLDVVGDVCGEVNSLRNLLKELGYSEVGVHPAGRKLIFVGNLCGRGQNSVDVIFLVKKLVEAGNAFSILGKNELHLLCADAKNHSDRLINEWIEWNQSHFQPDADQFKEVVDFLLSLPLILDCDGLCIVDAVWQVSSIRKIFTASDFTVIDLYEQSKATLNEPLKQNDDELAGIELSERKWKFENVTSFDRSVVGRLAYFCDELPEEQLSHLAAMRWPEQTIFFESGEHVKRGFEFLNYAQTEALKARSKSIRTEFQRSGSTMNFRQAIDALLNECGYLFGKFDYSSASEIELAEDYAHEFLFEDTSSISINRDNAWNQFISDLREDEYASWDRPKKCPFENLDFKVQLQWMSHAKEMHPRANLSIQHSIAVSLYDKSNTVYPRKS